MSSAFAVVLEAGPGNFYVHRFGSQLEALAKGKKLWCCWVAFELSQDGATVREIAHGGTGWAHNTIRRHAQSTFQSQARDQDARARAAAAAEARFASSNASQPKQSKPRSGIATNDGRPDVSNASAWD